MSVRQLLDADRVVEVARMLAVDRHRDRLAKIRAAGDVLFAHRAEVERLFDRRVAMDVGDAVLADDDLGVDALLVDITEHFDDLPDRTAGRGRPGGHFHHDHLTRLGLAPLAGRHMHVGHDAPVERLHEAQTRVVDIEAAHDGRIAALENADDAPFEAVLGGPALDAREDAIAVHGFLDVRSRHVDVGRIAAGLVGDDEAKARRVHLQDARQRDPSCRATRRGRLWSARARRSQRAISAAGEMSPFLPAES